MKNALMALIVAITALLIGPLAAQAQSTVFYVPDSPGTNKTINRITFPNSVASRVLAADTSLIAVDSGSGAPFYAAGGSVHGKLAAGLRPIILYANVTEGLTVDAGLRSIVFIGGSSVRTLYVMGFNPKADGRLPDPKALVSFSDSVTPRFVATLDTQYAFWSQDDGNGTSSIYRVPLKGSSKIELLHTQTDGDEGGRPITALAVDPVKEVLYFCQQGATSVIKALDLAKTGPTTLLTYDGQCRSIAVDGRSGWLFVAGTPNGNAPGLAGFQISEPSSYYQFELGSTVLSVAVQPARLLFDNSIKPAPPAVDVNKNDITVWLERFIKGSSPHFFRAVIRMPSGQTITKEVSGPKAKFSNLSKGSYSIRYRAELLEKGAPNKLTPDSMSRSFKIE